MRMAGGRPQASEWRRPRGGDVQCALHRAGGIFFCQGSDDYQRLRPEAGARFVLGFSMPIAWPAVADGVAQGTAPNRAVGIRLRVTVAT